MSTKAADWTLVDLDAHTVVVAVAADFPMAFNLGPLAIDTWLQRIFAALVAAQFPIRFEIVLLCMRDGNSGETIAQEKKKNRPY